MDIKIIVNDMMPPNVIMMAPDLKKYFEAVINGNREELEKETADLESKVAIIKNVLGQL